MNHRREIYRQRYIKFLGIYDKLSKDRQSALNGQYILYKLEQLDLDGDLPDRESYVITDNENTLEKYEMIWTQVCKILDWPIYSILAPYETKKRASTSSGSDYDPTQMFRWSRVGDYDRPGDQGT